MQDRQKQTPNKSTNKKAAGNNNTYNSFEIRFIAFLFLGLFVGMIYYLSVFTATKEQDMLNNTYNSRQQLLLSRNYRGTIYAADGEVLAESILDYEQNETRVYPYADLFAHVVGYTGQGKTGLENLMNYYLIQSNLSLSNRVENDTKGLKNQGDSVYTTLNVDLQTMADRQLSVYKGAVIVTEVKTGKILAMVSHPNFDPNNISEIWDSIVNSKNNSILLNRATQGLYPPGSTFKILTALEYYKENKDTFKSYIYQCNGSFQSKTGKISCNHKTSHGNLDFKKSFAKSCNSSFANIGMQLDRSDFSLTLQNLYFNKELPFPLPYSISSVPVPEKTDPDWEMMQTSIGQGKTMITPIHLNLITCAIANDGVLMTPYFVNSVISADGKTVLENHPTQCARLIQTDEAEVLKDLMEAVVEQGTATYLKQADYTSAGKTGSAEYSSDKDLSHAWFTGYAPAEDPEICVTVIVESAGTGGDYAVPIAKGIFDLYFHQLSTEKEAE